MDKLFQWLAIVAASTLVLVAASADQDCASAREGCDDVGLLQMHHENIEKDINALSTFDSVGSVSQADRGILETAEKLAKEYGPTALKDLCKLVGSDGRRLAGISISDVFGGVGDVVRELGKAAETYGPAALSYACKHLVSGVQIDQEQMEVVGDGQTSVDEVDPGLIASAQHLVAEYGPDALRGICAHVAPSGRMLVGFPLVGGLANLWHWVTGAIHKYGPSAVSFACHHFVSALQIDQDQIDGESDDQIAVEEVDPGILETAGDLAKEYGPTVLKDLCKLVGSDGRRLAGISISDVLSGAGDVVDKLAKAAETYGPAALSYACKHLVSGVQIDQAQMEVVGDGQMSADEVDPGLIASAQHLVAEYGPAAVKTICAHVAPNGRMLVGIPLVGGFLNIWHWVTGAIHKYGPSAVTFACHHFVSALQIDQDHEQASSSQSNESHIASCSAWCNSIGAGRGHIQGTAPFCNAGCEKDCRDGHCKSVQKKLGWHDYGHGCATGTKICCCDHRR